MPLLTRVVMVTGRIQPADFRLSSSPSMEGKILKTEVVVIGASLAGLAAARRLDEGGVRDFLVLESKPVLGLPLKCGEAVEATALEEVFPGIASMNVPWIVNRISDHKVRFEEVERNFSFNYFELDRPRFEQWLGEPVQDRLHLKTRVEKVERTDSGFRVLGDNFQIDCRGLILACGAQYKFQKELGLIKKEPQMGYAYGGLYAGPGFSSSQFLWELSERSHGCLWLFPKQGSEINLGIAALEPKAMRAHLDEFCRENKIASPRCTLGGKFPVSGVIAKTYAEGVLVAGDAAGMVYAGTGEGIGYALISGRLAGGVLARAVLENDFSKNFLKEYERLWRARFGARLKAGVRFKRRLVVLFKTRKLKQAIQKIPEPMLKSLMVTGEVPWQVIWRWSWQNLRDKWERKGALAFFRIRAS